MLKNWFIAGFIVALTIFMFANGGWALDKGSETIDINAQTKYPEIITKKDKKHVLDFPHHKHQDEYLEGNVEYAYFEYTDDYSCAACHHTSKAGEQPISCLKCKDVNKMLDKVGGEKKFEKIYHKNCRDGCHKKMDKAGKKTGPTKCKGCHGK